MRIARPFALELEYTREMLLPLLLRPDDWPRRVLLIGLGAGSLTKFLWRHRPRARLTVVEIEPRVTACARQFFRLPDDPRIDIQHADGADFVIRSKQKFDLILVDGFDRNARAGRLDSLAFYLDCMARLAAEGLLCVNLLSRCKDFSQSVARLEAAFTGHAIAFPSSDSGNAIAIALASPVADAPAPSFYFSEVKQAAVALKTQSGLNLLPTLARLAQAGLMAGDTLQLRASAWRASSTQ
ncbi:MAG: spermidine synthase [Betaproteobacteria bacterium HGW-Betaproteobacteria-11]|nr:MAG: spermidine synthase [Betaproteobacteria bacterium HGW-Betaproteobacteria-11]